MKFWICSAKKEGVKCRPPQFSHTKAEWSEEHALQSAQFPCIPHAKKMDCPHISQPWGSWLHYALAHPYSPKHRGSTSVHTWILCLQFSINCCCCLDLLSLVAGSLSRNVLWPFYCFLLVVKCISAGAESIFQALKGTSRIASSARRVVLQLINSLLTSTHGEQAQGTACPVWD